MQIQVETRDINGLVLKIEKRANKLVDNADRAGLEFITRWHRYTYEGWPVDQSTGADAEHSRDTITHPTKQGPGHYRFEVTSPYGGVIEYGGWAGVGPKTAQHGPETLPGGIRVGAGIFAIQKPTAPMRRAGSRVKLEMSETLSKMVANG